MPNLKEVYKPEEALQAIRDYLDELTGGGYIEGETLAPVYAILDRVAKGETITLSGIKAGCLEAITRASVNGAGLHPLMIQNHLERGGDTVPMASIEGALLELEREGRAHKVEGKYYLGRAPITD